VDSKRYGLRVDACLFIKGRAPLPRHRRRPSIAAPASALSPTRQVVSVTSSHLGSTAADTAAWRDLLPFGGLSQIEAFEHPAALEVLAVVLATHHGDPMGMIDGEPFPSRS
jgi:hypothetical protein